MKDKILGFQFKPARRTFPSDSEVMEEEDEDEAEIQDDRSSSTVKTVRRYQPV